MISSESHITIACPVAEVYDFVVEHFFDNYTRWSPEVVELEALGDRQVALGNRARQVREDHGYRHTSEFEVTHLDPQRAVQFDACPDSQYRIRFAFEPLTATTSRLYFEFQLRKVELYMRPFTKLIRRAIDHGTVQAVENIKALLESDGDTEVRAAT